MQWRSTTTKERPSGTGTLLNGSEGPRAAVGARQEWINRIWTPTRVAYNEFIRYFVVIVRDINPTDPELKERAEELGTKLARKRERLLSLVDELTGEEWGREHDRVQIIAGRMMAVEEVSRQREKAAQSSAPRSSLAFRINPAGSTSTAGLKPHSVPAEPEWDPFRDC